MKPTDLQEWILVIFGLIGIAFTAIATAAPPIGRVIAVKWPRFGEALIRFGSDWKNVFAARKLEPGTPSVSAQPLIESSAAVSSSAPSVAPPSNPPSQAKKFPPTLPPGMPLLVLVLVLSLVGCSRVEVIESAATVHSYATKTINAASPVLREECVEPMQIAAVEKDRDRAIAIDRRCSVPINSWDSLRAATMTLEAAIVAAATGDLTGLATAVADVVATIKTASIEIARLIRDQ